MIKQADIDAIVERITKTPMAPGERVRMLEHPEDLSLEESRKLYRTVDFGDLIPVSKKRHCDVNWTDHAEYRAELRDSEPAQVNHQVCERIFDRHFNPAVPKRKPADREKMKMQLPAGTAVVDYDATVEPYRADIVTTWRSAAMDNVSRELVKVARLLTGHTTHLDLEIFGNRIIAVYRVEFDQNGLDDVSQGIGAALSSAHDACDGVYKEVKKAVKRLKDSMPAFTRVVAARSQIVYIEARCVFDVRDAAQEAEVVKILNSNGFK